MKRIINTLIAAACLLPTLGLAATATFNHVADAYVQGGKNADMNYGSTTELRARSNNSPPRSMGVGSRWIAGRNPLEIHWVFRSPVTAMWGHVEP